MADAWQFNKSALECNKYMLENGIATDVTFLVANRLHNIKAISPCPKETAKERQTFKAHRFQLIKRSPVFDAMLCGGLAEKGDIVVDDVEPEAFKEMLNYIYTDKADIKLESVLTIMYASKKYQIPGLSKICVEFCKSNLTVDSACFLYDQGLFFDEVSLETESLKIIKTQTSKCFAAVGMLDMRQSTLSKILNCDTFSVPEIEVFVACVKWASHQVELTGKKVNGHTIREALGDCVHKIRYPVMDIKTFRLQVSPQGILLPEEELSIFRYLDNKDKHTLLPVFNAKYRYQMPLFTMLTGNKATVKVSIKSVSGTTFTLCCNSSIIVTEFILGEIYRGTCAYYGFGFGEHDCAADIKAEVDLDGKQYPAYVTWAEDSLKLQEKMILDKNTVHKLKIQLYESGGCMGRDGGVGGSTIKKAYGCKVDIKDSETGAEISISAANLFLVGVKYVFV